MVFEASTHLRSSNAAALEIIRILMRMTMLIRIGMIKTYKSGKNFIIPNPPKEMPSVESTVNSKSS